MDYLDIIENSVLQLKKSIKTDTTELKKYPKGRVGSSMNSGKRRYYQKYKQNGVLKRKSIVINDTCFKDLLTKEWLENKLKADIKNLQVLESSLKRMKAVSTIEFAAKKAKEFDNDIKAETIVKLLSGNGLKGYSLEHYEQSNYRYEERIIMTSCGIKVRSKSEALIMELFLKYGIEFHYEEVLNEGGRLFIPDFKIRRADGKVVYWEHCGLTNNPEYMRRHQAKLKAYAEMGIVPWKNLIVSYDAEDGDLNMKVIENEIRTKLMVD